MKKLFKILFWMAGILVALLLVAVLLVKIFFPLDKARAMAIEKGSAALGRSLEVGDVELSFWGGLGVNLKDIAIGNPENFSGPKLLVAEAVDVKLQLWPLISGDMMVDRLILSKPQVNMIVSADGSNNFTFDDVVSETAAGSEVAEKLEQVPSEAKAAAAVIAFDQLEIIDGQLIYVDKKTDAKTTISGLRLSTSLSTPSEAVYQTKGRVAFESYQSSLVSQLNNQSLAVNYAASYDLEVDSLMIDKADISLGEVELGISGSLVRLMSNPEAEMRIKTEELNISTLLGFLTTEQKNRFSDYDIGGRLAIEADIDYVSDPANPKLAYSGTAQLIDVSLSSSQVEGTFLIGRALLDFETDQARLTLEEASFNQKPLKGFLAVKQFDHPSISAELAGSLDLAFIEPFMPSEPGQSLKGLAEFALNISGQIDQPAEMAFSGDLKISDGQFISPLLPEPVNKFGMAVAISSESVRIDQLSLELESSDLALTGRVDDPFPYFLPLEGIDRASAPRPQAEFHLSSTRLDIDKLFPEAVPGSGAVPVGESGEVIIDSITTAPIPDIDGVGTIAIGALIYNKMDFSEVKGDVNIKDRKLTVSNATAEVFDGTVAGETTIDLSDFSNPHYVGQFEASQIEADGFVSRFSKFGGHLFGKVDLNGSYDARGWDPDAFLNSLTMNSVGSLDEGKLITSGAVGQLLGSLAEHTGESFDKEQPIRNLMTNIAVKDGKVYLDDFKTSLGNVGDISLGGYYGFDDKINYSAIILLSEAMTKKLASKGGLQSTIASILGGSDTKRSEVPFKVTGTTAKPVVSLDMSAIMQKATENLKDDAKKLLKGFKF